MGFMRASKKADHILSKVLDLMDEMMKPFLNSCYFFQLDFLWMHIECLYLRNSFSLTEIAIIFLVPITCHIILNKPMMIRVYNLTKIMKLASNQTFKNCFILYIPKSLTLRRT